MTIPDWREKTFELCRRLHSVGRGPNLGFYETRGQFEIIRSALEAAYDLGRRAGPDARDTSRLDWIAKNAKAQYAFGWRKFSRAPVGLNETICAAEIRDIPIYRWTFHAADDTDVRRGVDESRRHADEAA